MIRAVIFDFGGVLVRTENPSGRQKWEKALGLAPGDLSREVFESEAAFQASLGRLPEQAIWDHVARTYHLDPQQTRELEDDFWSGDRLDKVLVDFIKSLRPRYKTAILSNAWSGARLTFQETYELGSAVDLIVISAEEGLVKPDPQIFGLISKRLEVLPEEAIFVDDFPVNIRAAREIGFHAVQFENTRQTIDTVSGLIEGSVSS